MVRLGDLLEAGVGLLSEDKARALQLNRVVVGVHGVHNTERTDGMPVSQLHHPNRQSQTRRSFSGVARKRRPPRSAFMAEVMAEDTMFHWLAEVAREAREEVGIKHVRIAAALNMDQSSVSRFEKGEAWPRDPDAFIQAYGEELGIDPRVLWQRALERWMAEESPSAERAGRAVQAAAEASRGRRQSPRRSSGKRGATARKRASG